MSSRLASPLMFDACAISMSNWKLDTEMRFRKICIRRSLTTVRSELIRNDNFNHCHGTTHLVSNQKRMELPVFPFLASPSEQNKTVLASTDLWLQRGLSLHDDSMILWNATCASIGVTNSAQVGTLRVSAIDHASSARRPWTIGRSFANPFFGVKRCSRSRFIFAAERTLRSKLIRSEVFVKLANCSWCRFLTLLPLLHGSEDLACVHKDDGTSRFFERNSWTLSLWTLCGRYTTRSRQASYRSHMV